MEDLLLTGLKQLGLAPLPSLADNYSRYIELLVKWNKNYNLTAVRDPLLMVRRHILDSLTVRPFIQGVRCLDIGTGAGLPGMILALAAPEQQWILADSNQKKLRFLQHVKTDLSINNVQLAHTRIEQFQTDIPFDTLICRAFAPMPRLLEQARHLLTPENQLLAMKGEQVNDEFAGLNVAEFEIKQHKLACFDPGQASILVQISQADDGI